MTAAVAMYPYVAVVVIVVRKFHLQSMQDVFHCLRVEDDEFLDATIVSALGVGIPNTL